MSSDNEKSDIQRVVKEIPLTIAENPHGYGSRHLLECGHIIDDCDHDPKHYDPGDEVYCYHCAKEIEKGA